MPLNFDNIIGLHENALNMQAQRARILGANLANADTPGYKAKDIDFRAALSQVRDQLDGNETELELMKTTHARHIAPEGYIFGAELLYRQPMQPSLDGNTVESQVEMAEFSENSMRYLTSLRIINGRLNGLLTAFRGE